MNTLEIIGIALLIIVGIILICEIASIFTYGWYSSLSEEDFEIFTKKACLNGVNSDFIVIKNGYISTVSTSIIGKYYISLPGNRIIVPKWSKTHKQIKQLYRNLTIN